MNPTQLIDDYVAGPEMLRGALQGLVGAHFDARPVPGKWSVRQVVAHLADFEPVYADRMKRVIAQDQPLLPSGDPDLFAARLAYDHRDVEEELQLISSVRGQLARILRTLSPGDFQRTGTHSEDGPLSLETLLRRITKHIPHHVAFIDEKRKLLIGR